MGYEGCKDNSKLGFWVPTTCEKDAKGAKAGEKVQRVQRLVRR